MKHCLKKSRGEETLPAEKKEYNRNISKKRILVENHFADLKQFSCLSDVFEARVNNHGKAVSCCEVFLSWTRS